MYPCVGVLAAKFDEYPMDIAEKPLFVLPVFATAAKGNPSIQTFPETAPMVMASVAIAAWIWTILPTLVYLPPVIELYVTALNAPPEDVNVGVQVPSSYQFSNWLVMPAAGVLAVKLTPLAAALGTKLPFVAFTSPSFSSESPSANVFEPIGVVLKAIRVPWAVSVQASAAAMLIEARLPDE